MAGRPLRRARVARNNPFPGHAPSFGQRLYSSAQYKMYTDGPHPSSIDDSKHHEGGYRDMCIKALATFLTLEGSGLPLRDAVEYTPGSDTHIAVKIGDQYFVVWLSSNDDVVIERNGSDRVRWSEWSKKSHYPATSWFRR